jgi:hypothetical protein
MAEVNHVHVVVCSAQVLTGVGCETQFVSARVYEMRAQMNSGKVIECEKIPMLHRLLQYRYPATNSMMPDHDIISETMGHMLVNWILFQSQPDLLQSRSRCLA